MRANLSADSSGQVIGERSGTNVEPSYKLEDCSTKDLSRVLQRRQIYRQSDQLPFVMERYLNDVNPFDTFALGHDTSATPRNRGRAMKAYIEAWDVQFQEATLKNNTVERKV